MSTIRTGMGRVLDAAAERGYFAFGSDIKDRSPKHPLTISSVFDSDFDARRPDDRLPILLFARNGAQDHQAPVSELEHGSVEKVCACCSPRRS